MSAASYRDIIREISVLEAIGQWQLHSELFSLPPGGRADRVVRITEWPMVVFGLSAHAINPGDPERPLVHDAVLIRLSDSQSETPYMEGFYSLTSVVGREPTPAFMRLVKPLLLTENRGLRIELWNTGGTAADVAVVLIGVRIYGNPFARERRV
mgnify:CR=1 FL=1